MWRREKKPKGLYKVLSNIKQFNQVDIDRCRHKRGNLQSKTREKINKNKTFATVNKMFFQLSLNTYK